MRGEIVTMNFRLTHLLLLFLFTIISFQNVFAKPRPNPMPTELMAEYGWTQTKYVANIATELNGAPTLRIARVTLNGGKYLFQANNFSSLHDSLQHSNKVAISFLDKNNKKSLIMYGVAALKPISFKETPTIETYLFTPSTYKFTFVSQELQVKKVVLQLSPNHTWKKEVFTYLHPKFQINQKD